MKKEYYKGFKLNQYDEYNGGLFPYTVHVKARYIEQEIPEFRNNQCIEALCPHYSIEQISINMNKPPIYSSKEITESEEVRIQKIRRLEHYLFPITKHIEVANSFSSALRWGYKDRGFMSPQLAREMNLDSPVLCDRWSEAVKEGLISVKDNTDTANRGYLIMGISGAGKSTAIDNVLSMYPQVIVHDYVNGHNELRSQLVWVKVECTYTASIGDICKELFREVDKALGTEYYRKYKNIANNEGLFKEVEDIVDRHKVGAIIIDEVQNLSTAKNGPEKITNFFVRMENKLRVPIIYVGTYEAMKFMGKTLRGLRRAIGVEDVFFGNMTENEEDWNGFIENMWKFQWTREYCELTEEIRRVCYEKSMGVIDILIKLFMASQVQAILKGEEKLNTDLITETAGEYLLLTTTAVNALKNVGMRGAGDMDDITLPNIDGLFEYALNYYKNRKKIEEQVGQVINGEVFREDAKQKDIINKVIVEISKVFSDIDENQLYRITEAIVKKYKSNNELTFFIKAVRDEVIKLYNDKNKSESDNEETEKKPKAKKML